MRMRLLISVCSAIFAFVAFSSESVAQQKTAKACTEEWRADKANNQAKGITERAYVAACRNGTTPTPTAAAPAPAPTPAATPAPAPAAPTVARTAPSPAAPAPRAPSAGTPAGSGQFATEAEAKNHCPSDTVVWANLNSKIYHFSGTHNYGNTKSGAYMCESETSAAGVRAAKNEAHP
jgi:nucleoid-associated protein YgaU